MDKATKSIRARLDAYLNMRRELAYQTMRLKNIYQSIDAIKSPTMESASHNGVHDGVSLRVAEMMQLEEKIDDLRESCVAEQESLEKIISRIPSAEQRCLLRMRYFDAMRWSEITHAFFGDQIDYASKEDEYRRVLYVLHTRALRSMAHVKHVA